MYELDVQAFAFIQIYNLQLQSKIFNKYFIEKISFRETAHASQAIQLLWQS